MRRGSPRTDRTTGTANVLESESRKHGDLGTRREAGLKYDKTGKILLVPQPSDDPNDPLVRAPHVYPTSTRDIKSIHPRICYYKT